MAIELSIVTDQIIEETVEECEVKQAASYHDDVVWSQHRKLVVSRHLLRRGPISFIKKCNMESMYDSEDEYGFHEEYVDY